MLRAMDKSNGHDHQAEAIAKLERERQRVTVSLRQVADCIDALPGNELWEVLVRLAGPTEELLRTARLILHRPFGN